jgi:hypothetical protein
MWMGLWPGSKNNKKTRKTRKTRKKKNMEWRTQGLRAPLCVLRTWEKEKEPTCKRSVSGGDPKSKQGHTGGKRQSISQCTDTIGLEPQATRRVKPQATPRVELRLEGTKEPGGDRRQHQ